MLCALVFGVLVPLIKQNPVIFQGVAERYLGVTTSRDHRLYDYAGLIPLDIHPKAETMLSGIYEESDIDVRIMFVNGTGAKSIEELAVEKVEDFRIGGKTGDERGILLLYDFLGKRLRVEVGYGLEGYFPDAFVSYLVHDHAQAFFAAGDVNQGLPFLLRLVHHRIRQAIIGNEFDLAAVHALRQNAHLSGGAGASAQISSGTQQYLRSPATDQDRAFFQPQPTPEAAYQKYLEWLARGKFIPDVPLFTERTQLFLANFKMSKAYFDYILFREYGRAYKVLSHGDVAVMYFTNDPIVTPHFFFKTPKGWQMDIAIEVPNTVEVVGGVFTWCYRGRDDIYTPILTDKLVWMNNCQRIRDGDNRMLPMPKRAST